MILFQIFNNTTQQYLNKVIWKHNKTIMLHIKEDRLPLTNYRLIALANTIYKTLHKCPHCTPQPMANNMDYYPKL